MIELEKLPIVDPDPERSEREARDIAIEDGRSAFRAGWPVTRCPPFVDPDRAIDWRNGWRWESEGQ